MKCCKYLTISQKMVEVPLADLVTTVLERCQAVLSVAKYLFTSAQIKELFRKDYFQKYGWSKRSSVMKFLRQYFYCSVLKNVTGGRAVIPHVFTYWELIEKGWQMTYDTWLHFHKKLLVDFDHHDNLRWHKMRRKDVVGIVTFDLIGLLLTNHITAYITMAYQSLWENVWC